MGFEQSPNDTSPILFGILDAYRSSRGFAPPHGIPTLHQKAFFVCWASIVFIWLVRSLTRQLIPGRFNFLNAGVPSSASSISTQVPHEDIEKASTQDAINRRRVLPRNQADPITFDNFAHGIIVLGLIMYFFYICDYVHLFPKANRTYSRDLFVVLTLFLFVVAVGLTRRESDSKLLNRDQTEEWKGWMQVMFVWYHYFKAAEIYNAIRIFIAAYVWMTGFGNFSFFWVRKDYSIYRIMKMLFRLNFLVIVVTFVTNNQYMLYYICAMHTFWFLTVYAMMRPYQHLNENRKVMFIKFSIYAFIVFVIYDLGTANLVFTPFKFIFDFNGSLHEWEFRSGLDHYATFFGMICAYNHPNFERFLAFLEREPQSRWDRCVKAGIRIGVGSILCGIMILWYFWVYSLGKYDYNKLHPYTSIIPIIVYIFFRNIVPILRSRHAFLFTWLGKITLETYIAQLHVYMQGNAKELIVYIKDYPLVNFVLATVIYLFMSYSLFNVTGTVSGYLLPRDIMLLSKRMGAVAVWILSSYSIIIITSPQIAVEAVGYFQT